MGIEDNRSNIDEIQDEYCRFQERMLLVTCGCLKAHRLRKLQQFGANAWRTAHNPPNEALLAAADRLGVLVWDENHRNGQDSEMEAQCEVSTHLISCCYAMS